MTGKLYDVLMVPRSDGTLYPAAVLRGYKLNSNDLREGYRLVSPPPDVAASEPALVIEWAYKAKL